MSGLLELREVTKRFVTTHGPPWRRATRDVLAVDDVTLDVERGERFGIVGESGSGKSTLARAIVRLLSVDAGSVRFDGIDVLGLDDDALRRLRARMQLVLQDPLSSLDPRMTVRALVSEGLAAHGLMSEVDPDERVETILEQTGIGRRMLERKPYSLSGGQRQRVALARSIVLGPELVLLDEPVSALDVSVQAQILNLLRDLQHLHGLTYVFIVHDLLVARWFCTRVAVMYRGRVVEQATSEQLFRQPRHPYTRELLDAAPGSGAAVAVRRGRHAVAGLDHGCAFRDRCPAAQERCGAERPPLRRDADGRAVACHFPLEAPAAPVASNGIEGAR
jgi:oligopeptide/dipeptide ABC transporter ATP-binding protein